MDKFLHVIRFENYDRKESVPVIVYAHFECLVKSQKISLERISSDHEAFSIIFYVISKLFILNTSLTKSKYKCSSYSLLSKAELKLNKYGCIF